MTTIKEMLVELQEFVDEGNGDLPIGVFSESLDEYYPMDICFLGQMKVRQPDGGWKKGKGLVIR